MHWRDLHTAKLLFEPAYQHLPKQIRRPIVSPAAQRLRHPKVIPAELPDEARGLENPIPPKIPLRVFNQQIPTPIISQDPNVGPRPNLIPLRLTLLNLHEPLKILLHRRHPNLSLRVRLQRNHQLCVGHFRGEGYML